jgi:chromosome segregation ATPase
MNFLGNFLRTKANDANAGLLKAIVNLDPDAASKADLATMEQDLDKAGTIIVSLKSELVREQKELDTVSHLYSQQMSAAEIIQGQINDPNTPTDRIASLEASLSKLVMKMEELVPQLDQEKADVVATQSLLDEAQGAYKTKSADLLRARQNLDRAKQDLQRADIQLSRSQDRARQAAVVAGLSESTTSKLTTALDVMKQTADEKRSQAQVADMKATAFTKPADTDANIVAALAQAAANTAPDASLADRLSALKR